MAHLLKVLHQEDALSPSALAIVKGGDSSVTYCTENGCNDNSGTCTINKCQGNNGHCGTNTCVGNKLTNPNPDPSCNKKNVL